MNAHRPIAMPNGVVMANRMERVGFSQWIFHDSYVDWGGGKDSEYGEEGNEDGSDALGGGRDAIRIPNERPSNSWWKIIAVTRDTGD